MVKRLAISAGGTLAESVSAIGMTVLTLEDDAYLVPASFVARKKFAGECVAFVTGEEVRDYVVTSRDLVVMPSSWDGSRRDLGAEAARHLWVHRARLRNRLYFGRVPEERGLRWFDLGMLFAERHRSPLSITFAAVATHPHFVLDRGGKVFNRHAPVIKLREEASEEQYVRLFGLLNSSTACFWLQQVSHNKGEGGGARVDAGYSAMGSEAWKNCFEFTGTKLQHFPLPSTYPTELAAALDALAQRLSATSPAAVAATCTPAAAVLREARARWESTRARMIALQEELDWQVYSIYDLNSEELRVWKGPDDPDIPELAFGERAFELVLARRMEAGETGGEWFKRHGATPITQIPVHWPTPYREVVQKRIDVIESNRAIGMVERPEYKRRWATEGWEALQEKALRSWLLDRMENRDYWFDENGQPAILTLARLTDVLSRDDDFVSVAKLYAPRKELSKVVAEMITDEHVPFLSALRYKPSGLRKRADWEGVWDLQRKEDAAPDELAKRKIRDSIPVPPKYTSADFLRLSYWKARGKLDVPKERFISYGQTNAATPELYGWAGWDHREQAQALATYFTNTALSTEEITPFLAGLLELQPWLSQWHNEFDMLFSGSPADFFAGYRQQKQGEHGLTDDDLRDWRPPAATRGRRAAAKR